MTRSEARSLERENKLQSNSFSLTISFRSLKKKLLHVAKDGYGFEIV